MRQYKFYLAPDHRSGFVTITALSNFSFCIDIGRVDFHYPFDDPKHPLHNVYRRDFHLFAQWSMFIQTEFDEIVHLIVSMTANRKLDYVPKANMEYALIHTFQRE